MLRRLREPVNGLTHLAGALAAIVGLPVLLSGAPGRGGAWRTPAFAIFGISLILLYIASTLYHSLPLSPRGVRRLRRLDHMMVFALIAGSYTPICLVLLQGRLGWGLLGLVWGLSLAGMVLKLFWLHAPRWITTSVYMGLGWLVGFAAVPLVRALWGPGLAWFLLGGLSYTIGGLVYGFRWPNLSARWGFHELFHLCVLGGSFSHFWAVLRYF